MTRKGLTTVENWRFFMSMGNSTLKKIQSFSHGKEGKVAAKSSGYKEQ